MDLRCPAGQTSTRPGPNRRTPSCAQLRIQPQVRCPGTLLNVRCHSKRDDDPWCTNDNGSFRHPEMNNSSDEVDDSGLVMPASGADTDWREFRARLVASTRRTPNSSLFPGEIDLDGPSFSGRGTSVGLSTPTLGSRWAHSLPRPEKGCLLLAHPMMFRDSQTYFYQAVILITEHCEAGTVGVILNKPSMYTLSELHLTHPLPEFNNSRLYVGGDVGGGEITLIHTHPELPGSQEVVKGINMGGIHAAQAAVAGGTAKTQDFRWFAKYAGWRAGQLEAECRRGVWFTAAASPAVIMGEPSSGDGSDQWHSVLRLMGGDYEQLSYNVRASERRQRQAVAQREQQLKQQDEDDEGKGRGPGPEDANTNI